MNKVTFTSGILEDRVWYRAADPLEDLTDRETFTPGGEAAPVYVKMTPEEVLHLIGEALKPSPWTRGR